MGVWKTNVQGCRLGKEYGEGPRAMVSGDGAIEAKESGDHGVERVSDDSYGEKASGGGRDFWSGNGGEQGYGCHGDDHGDRGSEIGSASSDESYIKTPKCTG